MADTRRNLKITDGTYYKIRSLMKVIDLKQYELIDEMADAYVKKLSSQEREFFDYQLKEITRLEEKKKKKNQSK